MQVSDWRRGSISVGENQARAPQLAEQLRMVLGERFQPSRFVWLHAGNFEHDCGKLHDLLILRPCQFLEAGHVLGRNVRLGEEIEDLLLALYDSAIGFRHGLTALAHMDPVALARKLFVGSFTSADSAVMSHSAPVFLLTMRVNRRCTAVGHTLAPLPRVGCLLCAASYGEA